MGRVLVDQQQAVLRLEDEVGRQQLPEQRQLAEAQPGVAGELRAGDFQARERGLPQRTARRTPSGKDPIAPPPC